MLVRLPPADNPSLILSGHSSTSFFSATYLAIYITIRLANCQQTTGAISIFRSLKPFYLFGLITLAFWISLTRIVDSFHHPMDVVTGALTGIIFAVITILFTNNTHSLKREEVKEDMTENVENATHPAGSVEKDTKIKFKDVAQSFMSTEPDCKDVLHTVKQASV